MAIRTNMRPLVLFLHIGWARDYLGSPDDRPVGKFGFFKNGGSTGVEALNFKGLGGRCYGYAPHYSVNLARLGGKRGDLHVDGVLVVWTANDPGGRGRYIVGWYKNAKVYSSLQKKLRPGVKGDMAEALVEAAKKDCHRVPVDERTFFVPSMKVGWPGIAGAFYASKKLSAPHLERIFDYITHRGPSTGFYPAVKVKDEAPAPKRPGGWPTQDPELRAKIEKAAVRKATRHYKALGWQVKSVEKENFGWDLDVSQGGRRLRVEVKGRFGKGIVELTPNEYGAMQNTKTRMSYRLAIVHEARSASAALAIFEYAPVSESWVNTDDSTTLNLEEMTGARVSF